MESARRCVLREDEDNALYLPPMAEMEQISHVTAMVGARCRFQTRGIAKGRDQFLRVIHRRPVGDKKLLVDGWSPAVRL